MPAAEIPREHPRDALGRVLPEPGWPPGREAPGRLECLRRFVNTNVIESGGEAFVDPEALDCWLVAEGWNAALTDEAGLERVRAFRAAIRAVIADRGTPEETVHWSRLSELAEGVHLVLTADGALRPATAGVPGLFGTLIEIIATARADGNWERLKACRNHECRWLYYDRSKSQNGAWCWMGACGSRTKQREYRKRRASH
jgi:predicted RNA-binding Zn ribbon-like protein